MNNNIPDPIDMIVLDVPLFLRLLEYAKEDAQEDVDLHFLTQNAIKLTKSRGVLEMADYEELIPKQNNYKFKLLYPNE